MEFPQKLRTRRLLLTRMERGDLDDFRRMRSDPQVTEALGEADPQQAAVLIHKLGEHWERHGFGWWIARDPGSGRFLGCGGLRLTTVDRVRETELAYGFVPAYWGRGYATELVRVAVAQGFVRLGVRDIVSFVLPGNQASCRVMDKAGFSREREFIHAARPHALYRLKVDAWRVAPLMPSAIRPRDEAALQTV